ncbi:extracellular solute-binding protein, partial [Mangrovactinospora gilvigrisea]|uniref:extracellular solute-binding protein n=1 Tax=Mangrovactinospora gilvigrisea TaxID=1428644 RepID=UPI001114AD04
MAAGLGTTLSGCASDTAGLQLGKPVPPPGAKTVINTSVGMPEGYMGPRPSIVGKITTKPATLRVLVMQDSTNVGDWNTNKFTKWYENRTGVKVDWVVISSEDSLTKINAMIAANDIPDVLMPNPGLTPSQVRYYGDQGLFIRLNELIDKYGTQTKGAFRDYPEFRKTMQAPNGSLYSLPYINDCFHCHTMGSRTWLYQPWLDKLGLDVPQTTAEFEEVLHAFKTGDPNGDGKKDIVPFAISSFAASAGTNATMSNSIDQLFMNAFLYNPGNPWLALDGGKVDLVVDKPEWRDALRYMHRLTKQGLIDPRSFTMTDTQLQLIGNSKKVVLGCSMGNIWASFQTMDMVSKDATWRHYNALPSLKGPEGVRNDNWNYYEPLDPGRYM